ncbi:hypothetical protein ACMFWY_15955 [Roseiconus sp. JC912]|uniref:hypothetical protein n=1 Tax=Roseiconus sp. JC912 TaxID=3396307 RepID=UPI003A4C7502
MIEEIAKEFPEVSRLNRNAYTMDASGQTCFAIDEKLSKYFCDYGHHTLAGAKIFGGQVDRLRPLIEYH